MTLDRKVADLKVRSKSTKLVNKGRKLTPKRKVIKTLDIFINH